jgi:hypothetical protein
VTLASDIDNKKYRTLKWKYSPNAAEGEAMLDSGWETDGGLRIEAVGDSPLTILAISPIVAQGG